jgi:hypothetical protein
MPANVEIKARIASVDSLPSREAPLSGAYLDLLREQRNADPNG